MEDEERKGDDIETYWEIGPDWISTKEKDEIEWALRQASFLVALIPRKPISFGGMTLTVREGGEGIEQALAQESVRTDGEGIQTFTPDSPTGFFRPRVYDFALWNALK
jgi:hypothetical protein